MSSRTSTLVRRASALTGVTTLAFAGAALTGPAAQAAEKTFTYTCTASVFGGSVDLGEWTVAMNVDLPTEVGVDEDVEAPAVSATVTTSPDAANLVRNLGYKSVSGTATSAYQIDDADFDAKVTVPKTTIPASGPIVATGTGAGEPATAPSEPGTSTVTVGAFSAELAASKDDGSDPFNIPVRCTLKPGTSNVLGTIAVVDDAPSPTTSTSTTSPSTSTSTATATSSGTVSGPPVETGQVGDGSNASTVTLGLLALSGLAAAGFATRRRLND